jgi:hypothetical protein
MAPIYDTGTSLWYSQDFIGGALESKPFKSSHAEQIKLVSDFSWFNYDALGDFREEMLEIYAKATTMLPERGPKIADAVMQRAAQIRDLVPKRSIMTRLDEGKKRVAEQQTKGATEKSDLEH